MGKILIIKMTALGDVAAALAHIEKIYAHHEADELFLLTGPEAKILFDEHPKFKVCIVDRDRFFSSNGVWATIKWVRQIKFDRIYDLQGNKLSYRICRWSGASERIGTQPNPAYTNSPETKWVRTTSQNVAERLNNTLACAKISPATEPGRLYVNNTDFEVVAAFKTKHGLKDKNYAVFHAGSSPKWQSKRWPEDYFASLASMLEPKGISAIFTGAEAEKKINARITAKAGIDATGVFSIRQLYLIAQSAAFAVSNDSAPMHVFSAAKIPVFALFGPTNHNWSHGFGQKENVITANMECSPCFKGKCPPAQCHACMKNITPENLLDFLGSVVTLLPSTISPDA